MQKQILFILAVILVAVLLLGFCFAAAKEARVVRNTAQAASAATPAPEPSLQPTPQPTPEPTPTPEPPLPEGMFVTVDGIEAGKLVIAEEEECICLDSLVECLGAEVKSDGLQVQILYHGFTAEVTAISNRGVLWLPLKPVCEGLHIALTRDEEMGRVYCTPGAGDWPLPEGCKVPVLMYHAVSDNCWGIQELFVSPSAMEEQLKYIVENGYRPIWFEDLYCIDQIEKPVILTFDDGYKDNYEELFPLLKKYNVKATIFLITDNADNLPLFLVSEQIREMVESGLVSVQSHTASHPDMARLSAEDQRSEMERASLSILRKTGKQPLAFAYPSGSRNSSTTSLAEELYRFSVLMSGPTYITGRDRTSISRYYISRYTSLNEFATFIQG